MELEGRSETGERQQHGTISKKEYEKKKTKKGSEEECNRQDRYLYRVTEVLKGGE